MKLKRKTGYFVTIALVFFSLLAPLISTSTTDVNAATLNNKQKAVVNMAKAQLGKPYVWGGHGPNSFDCSGLVQYVYQHAVGMSIPAPTTTQERYGKAVSLSSLAAGDLLFWGNKGASYHVAIYIGGGNFIQAPQPGDVVKITNMKYYYPSFARRVLSIAPDLIKHGTLEKLILRTSQIQVIGWSAATNSVGKKYSYLFALDATTNRELKRWKINRVNRPDVQKAYPDIPNSLSSGFNNTFEVPSKLKGHKIKIMARYTSDPIGDYNTSDQKFNSKILTLPSSVSRSCIDSLEQQGNNIHARGWHIANYIENKPYRFAIVLDATTHQEYNRIKIETANRPDVQKAYPNVANSLHSGFNTDIPITQSMRGKKVFLVLRYSADASGDPRNIDSWATKSTLTVK